MISIEEGLTYQLKNHAGLNALISGRVYPLRLPQSATLPAVTYQRISTPRVLTHDQAAGGLATPRFQFNCIAENYDTAKAIVAQVRAALNGFRGSFGSGASTVTVWGSLSDNELDQFDPESGLYWTMTDYIIQHEE